MVGRGIFKQRIHRILASVLSDEGTHPHIERYIIPANSFILRAPLTEEMLVASGLRHPCEV